MEGLEPHRVQEIYMWGSEEPDTFLDITDTFSAKMDALYCHASQMKRPREEREAQWRERFAEIGKKAGVPLAEQFKRISLGR
jgi:LmbE family N-acetylglucosaminyl deacetylase